MDKLAHSGLETTGATRQLAEFITGMRQREIPAATLHRARYHTLDTLGALLSGAVQDTTERTAAAIRASGASGVVPVPGRRERLDLTTAALLSGTAGHGLEVDDGNRAGSVHPGTVVLPAAFAGAWALGSDGETFLRAVIAGYEAMCRLSAAIHPYARYRGFHNTPATGVFGAAAVWSVLKGHDLRQTEDALGAASSAASGLFTFLNGGEIKRLHAGYAARSGLLAGLLSDQGIAGPAGPLESVDGFFHAFGAGDIGQKDYTGIDILRAGGGHEFAIHDCYIKPYACCRHIHAPLDALRGLMREHALTEADVAALHVGTYKVATAHDLRNWESFTSAQMSIPFTMANCLRHGSADVDLFSERYRNDPATAELAGRVTVGIDPDCEADYPATRPARVTLTLRDGRKLDRRVDQPFGAPANPLSDAELEAKFLGLARLAVSQPVAEALAKQVWAIGKETDMRALVEATALR